MRESEPCDWHALTSEHSLQQLHSGDSGLTSAQAFERLQEHGLNQLPQRAGLTPGDAFCCSSAGDMRMASVGLAVPSVPRSALGLVRWFFRRER